MIKYKDISKIFMFILMIVISNDIYSQSIKIISNSDLDAAVISIESYLNNKKPNSKFGTISVNEWNPSYHNGYSPKCTIYILNT